MNGAINIDNDKLKKTISNYRRKNKNLVKHVKDSFSQATNKNTKTYIFQA